jgi:acylphosphatase
MDREESNTDIPTTARKVVVSGRVQGVGYRFFCQRKANEFGVRGWAKNCADGTVQVMAVGSVEALRDFVAELGRGPRFGKVEGVAVSNVPDGFIEEYESGEFYIR